MSLEFVFEVVFVSIRVVEAKEGLRSERMSTMFVRMFDMRDGGLRRGGGGGGRGRVDGELRR